MFVDASGRNWCLFSYQENLFIVDTNGFSQPNRFGKDRWMFTFADLNNKRADNYMNYKKSYLLSRRHIRANLIL